MMLQFPITSYELIEQIKHMSSQCNTKSLPLMHENKPENKNEHAGHDGNKKKKKVLVCDDNIIIAQTVEQMLTLLNCKSTLANNGLSGLNACKQQKFDIIFMDQQMPVMTGTETIPRIKQDIDSLNKDTPIIMLSASIIDKEIKDINITKHISKPCTIADLRKIIENI